MRVNHLMALGSTGFHRLSYREWGDPDNPKVLVCLHGLTRNCRDFDLLAQRISARWRVICPDMAGRGDSEWLKDDNEYNIVTYRNDCAQLFARLNVEELAWLGTSMGGVIGISLAAMVQTPITRMVINDIGPFVPGAGLQRIASQIGSDPWFPDLGAVEAVLRKTMTSFGVRHSEHWQHIARTAVRPAAEGGFRLHYDPGIARAFVAAGIQDNSFWSIWDKVACPTLVLRGKESDILDVATAQEMTQRGPSTDLVEIPGCGHAPMLMEEDQIDIVSEWLES